MTEKHTCPYCGTDVVFEMLPDPLLSDFRAVCAMHIAAEMMAKAATHTVLDDIATDAVNMADALIAELNKRKVKE